MPTFIPKTPVREDAMVQPGHCLASGDLFLSVSVSLSSSSAPWSQSCLLITYCTLSPEDKT